MLYRHTSLQGTRNGFVPLPTQHLQAQGTQTPSPASRVPTCQPSSRCTRSGTQLFND